MEQEFLSEDVYEQVKDFNVYELTEDQKSLIDKLILNEELKSYYKGCGLCEECKRVNTGEFWCKSCNAKRFQENFKNWTSGNSKLDEIIQKSQLDAKNFREILEWVEYDKFENINYIAKGGFGKIYKATWKNGFIKWWEVETNEWDRHGDLEVALKLLNNSKNITLEFLNEIKLHLKMSYYSRCVINIFGVTKDPNTNDFIMVMQYAKDGNLRHDLNKNFNSMTWKKKIGILSDISRGIRDIHENELTHQDFHTGNILNNGHDRTSITDLGLSKPANEKSEKHDKNIYGVLPYVAPEVLKGKEYTKESDIYSFGIILYEVFNGIPPYHEVAHDEFLGMRICQGLRPKFNINVPQVIEDIFKKCVNADSSKRPSAEYLYETIHQWHLDLIYDKEDSEIVKQVKEANEFSEKQSLKSSKDTELTYTTHSQAIYTSRLLKFNNLPEPRNADNEDSINSESIVFDFTKLNMQ